MDGQCGNLVGSVVCVDDISIVGAVFFLAGPIFYGIMYARYRNKGERHYHERETSAQMSNLQVYDVFIRQETRQSSSRILGANSTQVSGTLAAHGRK